MSKYLFILAICISGFSASAEEWHTRQKIDPLYDDVINTAVLIGEVVDGSENVTDRTSIVFKENGKNHLFYWVTPILFICDATKPKMTVRFGTEEPEDGSFLIADGKDVAVFTSPAYMLTKMEKYGSFLVRISDHCGNYATAKFEGSPRTAINLLDPVFESDWQLSSSGTLRKPSDDGKVWVAFTGLADSDVFSDEPGITFDLAIDLHPENPDNKRVEVQIGDKTFYGVIRRYQYVTLREGYDYLSIREITNELLLDALENNPVIKITLASVEYEIDISGLTPEVIEILAAEKI